jgi:heme-degrading monooxygenase HmoA
MVCLQPIRFREAVESEPQVDLQMEGLREANVVVDPSDPTRGMLLTFWNDLGSAQKACGSSEVASLAKKGSFDLAGEPQLLVTPRPGLY